jgi:hypothetical protein
MDSKGFFLGLIAAVVLFLLWRKEQSQNPGFTFSFPSAPPPPVDAISTSQCPGCGAPSYAGSPAVQGAQASDQTAGQISPGAPPLNSGAGTGSFYTPTGPTPDTGFYSYPAPIVRSVTSGSDLVRAGVYANVPGSATTPATQVPVRAAQPVGTYAQMGFQQRYNIAGVPRVYASQLKEYLA